jgi:hypothetical protein
MYMFALAAAESAASSVAAATESVASSVAAAAESVASTASTATQSVAAAASSTVSTAAAAGAVAGIAAVTATTIMIVVVAWYVLQIIADWKIFTKADEPGWKSIIPIYHIFVEYGICWNSLMGLIFLALTVLCSFLTMGENIPMWRTVIAGIASIAALVIHFIQSVKLSKSFGKGTGFGIILFLFGPIGRMILGFGSSTYEGPQ